MGRPLRCLLVSVTGCYLALVPPPAPAAPIPPPKPRPGAYQVDFANLPGATVARQYSLFVNAIARDRTSTVVVHHDPAGMTPAKLREWFLKSFEECGWRVRAVGETAFVIEGRKQKDFSPVDRVTAKALPLPAQHQPLIRGAAVK